MGCASEPSLTLHADLPQATHAFAHRLHWRDGAELPREVLLQVTPDVVRIDGGRVVWRPADEDCDEPFPHVLYDHLKAAGEARRPQRLAGRLDLGPPVVLFADAALRTEHVHRVAYAALQAGLSPLLIAVQDPTPTAPPRVRTAGAEASVSRHADGRWVARGGNAVFRGPAAEDASADAALARLETGPVACGMAFAHADAPWSEVTGGLDALAAAGAVRLSHPMSSFPDDGPTLAGEPGGAARIELGPGSVLSVFEDVPLQGMIKRVPCETPPPEACGGADGPWPVMVGRLDYAAWPWTCDGPDEEACCANPPPHIRDAG